MGLLKQFEGMQLPAASELEWLVPEHDAPQKVDFVSFFLFFFFFFPIFYLFD